MDTLALTDRDGTYGAVRFAKACLRAGIRPVLGVDLAYRPAPRCRAAASARSPQARDPRAGRGVPRRRGCRGSPCWPRAGAGWAALCRLVSATHLAGERGGRWPPSTSSPSTRRAVTCWCCSARPPSWAARRRCAATTSARAVLAPWLELVRAREPPRRGGLPPVGAGSGGRARSPHAARMAGLARSASRLGAVLTNAVRYADRRTRRRSTCSTPPAGWSPLDLRHVDRGNAEGFLKSGKQMHEVAEEICRLAGLGRPDGAPASCWPGPGRWPTGAPSTRGRDLGIGRGALPGVRDRPGRHRRHAGPADGRRAAAGAVRGRDRRPLRRAPAAADLEAARRRARDRSASSGYASYFLTVGDVTDLIRELGIRCAARGSGAGSLVNYLLGISGVDPIRHGLLMERFLSPLRQSLPDIDIDVESARRLEVYDAILDRYGGERCVVRLDDGHLPGAPRGP